MIEHERRLRELLPGAQVYLTGSASIPELDPTDIDLVVLVDDVGVAAEILSADYPVPYPDRWREDRAGFRDAGPPQVDIVVTRAGSLGDKHHRLAWERFERVVSRL